MTYSVEREDIEVLKAVEEKNGIRLKILEKDSRESVKACL